MYKKILGRLQGMKAFRKWGKVSVIGYLSSCLEGEKNGVIDKEAALAHMS